MATIAQSPYYQILKKCLKNFCTRNFTFLDKNNNIFNLQFGFRQQYSTSHTLINKTENIVWGVFVDL